MKRCPECRRDYYDDSLLYCLDDGSALLEGPASGSMQGPTALADGAELDEPKTAILHGTTSPAEAATRAQIHSNELTAVLPSRITEAPRARPFDKRLLLAPVALAVIVLGGFAVSRILTVGSKIGSIAVMPFVNESGNPENEYLSDGMTESLISSLAQIPDISVKARSSVFRYKGKDNTPRSIGEDLNVEALLNGRVVQRSDQLTLSLELIDAQTENVIWSESFSRKASDLPSLQREIVSEISNKLAARLTGADRAKLVKNYTTDAEAYRLYLQGRFHWNKRTVADIQRSLDFFRQSIQRDPNFALGYAGLADAYTLLTLYHAAPPGEAYPRARESALKALSLDADLAEAHASLGFVTMNDYYPVLDSAGAERAYIRAIELNPNLATTYHYYGLFLGSLKRRDQALDQARKGLEIEPFSSLFNRAYGDRLLEVRRYDDAIAQYKKTLELDVGFGTAYYGLGIAHQMKGEHAQAVENFAKFQEVSGDQQAAEVLRDSFRKGGWTGFLRTVVDKPVEFNVGWHSSAAVHAALGDRDRAFAELDRAYRKREPWVLLLNTDPRFDALSGDTRLIEIKRRLNLP